MTDGTVRGRWVRRDAAFERLIRPVRDVGRSAEAQQQEHPSCPVRTMAEVMVSRAIGSDPALLRLALTPSAVLVIEVPHADWVEDVAEAWREQVRGTEEVPHDGDDAGTVDAPWVEFRRPGGSAPSQMRMQTPDNGNTMVRSAVASGRAVYGFAPDPARLLPADLLRSADLTVQIRAPDGEGLSKAIAYFCGRPGTQIPSNQDARLVLPSDLLLAVRPDRDPDVMLRRVIGLARNRARVAGTTPRLADLHGMSEAVDWGRALARDISEYRSGKLAWSAVDRGALVAGPTGTGKTTFARALAAECGVPLVIGSVAAWQASGQGYLGDMLKAMRETFSQARALAPCVVFIDELDSLGDREGYEFHNRNYGIQVINAFLELVDGVAGREGVVVLSATNRPEALDPAILRPGRLDQVITIGLPDAKALVGIFRHHLGADLPNVELSDIAHRAVGQTGAMVERWIRSARRAARHQGRPLELRDLDVQVPDREAELTAETLWRVAVHEAGHALVICVLRPGALQSVSTTACERSASLGNVEWLRVGPEETEQQVTRESLLIRLAEILAGRAAEIAILGHPSAGAGGPPSSDLAQATWMATMAVTAFGLETDSRACPSLWRGLITPERVPALLSREPDVAARASALLTQAHQTALHIVEQGRGEVERIARRLLEQRSLTGDQVEALIAETAPGACASVVAARPKRQSNVRQARKVAQPTRH